MSTHDDIARLSAQIDALKGLHEVEEVAAAAKAAYRSDKTPENKAAHREASAALIACRAAARADRSGVSVGGDVTVG
jgi:hypothetical protein